jgi:hypothetical protein
MMLGMITTADILWIGASAGACTSLSCAVTKPGFLTLFDRAPTGIDFGGARPATVIWAHNLARCGGSVGASEVIWVRVFPVGQGFRKPTFPRGYEKEPYCRVTADSLSAVPVNVPPIPDY